MAVDGELAERVRQVLTGHAPVREVRTFSGLALVVDERMVVCVRGHRDLLVRADPERADELLARPGARPAEMGAGRPMGRGWTSVGQQALTTDEDLRWWIGVALDLHRRTGDAGAADPGRIDSARVPVVLRRSRPPPVEPDVGLEPTTYRLQGGCSTTELIRRSRRRRPHRSVGQVRRLS